MVRLPDHITTLRLTLRAWTPADLRPLAAAVAESVAHLRPFMSWAADEPLTDAERLALIERWRAEREAGGDCVLGIFRDGEVIGSTGLLRGLGPAVLEIGYWIHPDHLRCGYATEAAQALTTAAFALPEIHRVEIHHDAANTASAGVPRGLGFTLVATEARGALAPRDTGIEWQWAMERTDWEQRR